MSVWTTVLSRPNPVPILRHTEFHLYICHTLCFRRVRTCGLMYVLRVLSAVLPYGVWYYPLITRGRKFLVCCYNLNSTSAGSFAGESVDIFYGAFNLSLGITIIFVVIFWVFQLLLDQVIEVIIMRIRSRFE